MQSKERKEINPAYLNEAYNYLRRRGVVLSKKELAEVLDKSRTSVSKALNGNKSYLNVSFLNWFNAKFGNIFNPDYLLDGIGSLLCCNPDDDDDAIFNPEKGTIPSDVINDNETGIEKDKQEIEHLKELLRAKDELIASKDNQIRLLEMIVGRGNDKKV